MPYAIDRNSVTDCKFDTNSTRIRQMEWYCEKHGNGNLQFASVSEITLVKSKNLFGDS
jgi:hypothetical protein